MATERLISPASISTEEQRINWSLRPQTIGEYIGQRDFIERLKIAMQAVKERAEPMDHVLLHGPPGLGKTTLAHVIGNEMGVAVRATSGPAIEKPGDLVGIVT